MSSLYDMEPLKTPPWWPGILALVILAAIVIALAYLKF